MSEARPWTEAEELEFLQAQNAVAQRLEAGQLAGMPDVALLVHRSARVVAELVRVRADAERLQETQRLTEQGQLSLFQSHQNTTSPCLKLP